MVLKRCSEYGCSSSPRCGHGWHINLNLRRGKAGLKPERGPVEKYMFLLPPGSLIPKTKAEALDLEARVRTWVLQGRPAVTHDTPPSGGGSSQVDGEHEMRIAAAAAEYQVEHLEATMKEPGPQLTIMRQLVAWRPSSWPALGERSISALLDHKLVRGYLRVTEHRTSASTADHHYARWSHFLNWCRREYNLAGESPFHHRSLRPQGLEKHLPDTVRHRRLTPDEDAALIKAFTAADDGGMMLGRYFCALDALLRRGEMLKVERSMVKREKVHGATAILLKLPGTITKTGKPRDIPVESERLKEFLERRRFQVLPFGQLDGAVLSESNFRTDWENALHASGIYQGEYQAVTGKVRTREWVWTNQGGEQGPLHWHDLRHEGASRLHEDGVPLMVIKDLLGHTSLATTQRYLNPTDRSIGEHLRRVANGRGL